MTLTLIVVATFRTSAHIGLAFGLAVNCDFILTSIFLTMVMLTVWRTNVFVPVVYFAIFGTIEITFLSSSIMKIPTGGWFSLMMAVGYGAPAALAPYYRSIHLRGVHHSVMWPKSV